MSDRAAAFFDVDKTILSENSATLYLRELYLEGAIDWRTMLENLTSYLRYKVNLLDVERFAERTLAHFRGRSEAELELEAARWVERALVSTIYPEARELLRKHRARGDLVALVSGAIGYVVVPLARHLGVEHVMHTHLEVRDGRFTGRVIQPVCYGEGKIYWLQQLIEREGIELARSFFYSDSVTDLPLLDLVGHPVVVNPDPLLLREARRRRWPVRLFRAPGEGGSKEL